MQKVCLAHASMKITYKKNADRVETQITYFDHTSEFKNMLLPKIY